jgi:hypothetical protein
MPTPPGTSEVVSQTGLLAIAAGTPLARVSQAGLLAVERGLPQARISQFGLLVIVPNVSVVTMPGTLDISPSRVSPNQTKTVTFILNGSTWASAPTITPSGLAGVSVGAVTLVNPTTATAPVTYGATAGTVTFTESSGGATINQRVGLTIRWVPRRSYR